MLYRFILPNVFSCPFSNTAIAEVDEKNLRAGARAPGMSSKKRFVFLLFFQKNVVCLRGTLLNPIFFLEKESCFETLENRKVARRTTKAYHHWKTRASTLAKTLPWNGVSKRGSSRPM